ncbi:MAG TPA: type II secretion system protein GspJ [Gammaproteobacteria bacterium]|jgi:general secretion pathway protein J|nr:type II secretion system protein GspJ [Gammaproteobacteria bacterium]
MSLARMPRRRRNSAGFTLIELLVASAIFVIIGGAAYAGWYQIQQVRESSELHSQRLAELQRVFYWLSEDIEQLAQRPIRDEVGSDLAALRYSEQGTYLIELTRGGWANPAEDILPPRGHMQRVAWYLEDGKLYRKYWYYLDRLEEGSVKTRRLAEKVAEVGVRFLNGEEWTEQWPPANAESNDDSLPRAIEMTLDLDDFGEVRRVFVVPG